MQGDRFLVNIMTGLHSGGWETKKILEETKKILEELELQNRKEGCVRRCYQGVSLKIKRRICQVMSMKVIMMTCHQH